MQPDSAPPVADAPVAPVAPVAPGLGGIARLAFPVTVSRLGALLLVTVDVAAIGRVSSLDLAYYGIAGAVYMVMFMIGIGFLIGTAVLTAQADGAGRRDQVGLIWRVSMIHAGVLGLASIALGLFGTPLFGLLGQDAALAGPAGDVLLLLALGMPGQLGFAACIMVLEALKRPYAGVVVLVLANALNLLLNALLMAPDGAWQPGEGAALATTIVRNLGFFAIAGYLLWLPALRDCNLWGGFYGGQQVARRLRRLGLAMACAQGVESISFASLTMMAGLIGASAVAGFQVAMNLIAFVFMGAIGIGTATAVHVGNAVGRLDGPGVRRAGLGGVLAITLLMLAFAVLLIAAADLFVGWFTNDPAVAEIAIVCLSVATVMLVGDGLQAVLMAALRAIGDTWLPTFMHLCAFVLVMVPAAAILVFTASFGAAGLFGGAAFGVTVAAGLLGWRFWQLSGRPPKRS